MMIRVDLVAIGVEVLRIDSRCSLEKEFTELIHMNSCMVLYLTISQVHSCHGYVCGLLTGDTKGISQMDDCIFLMTYKFLIIESLKYHILDQS